MGILDSGSNSYIINTVELAQESMGSFHLPWLGKKKMRPGEEKVQDITQQPRDSNTCGKYQPDKSRPEWKPDALWPLNHAPQHEAISLLLPLPCGCLTFPHSLFLKGCSLLCLFFDAFKSVSLLCAMFLSQIQCARSGGNSTSHQKTPLKLFSSTS